jgi:hypothetical protein
MNRLLLTLVLILLCAGATHADRTRTITGFLGGGVSFVSGEFTDFWNQGIHGLLGARIKVARDLKFIPKVEYHAFSFDDRHPFVTGGSLSSLMMGGAFAMEFGDRRSSTRPFGIGGGGFASVTESAVRYGSYSEGKREHTRPYFEIGLGVTIQATENAQLVFMGRFVSVFLEGITLNYIPLTFGFRF